MDNSKKKVKKELRVLISEALVNSLSKLKEGMGEKKFKRNIRKASKVLVSDFKIAKTNVAKSKKKEKQSV